MENNKTRNYKDAGNSIIFRKLIVNYYHEWNVNKSDNCIYLSSVSTKITNHNSHSDNIIFIWLVRGRHIFSYSTYFYK